MSLIKPEDPSEMGCSGNSPADKIAKLMAKMKSGVCVVPNGGYSNEKLAKYSREKLESVVTHLVETTSGMDAKTENYRRPKWWPKELTFALPLENLKKLTPNSSWKQVLRNLVRLYQEFYAYRNRATKRKLEENANCHSRHRPKKPKNIRVLSEIHNNCEPVVFLYDILKTNLRTVTRNEFSERLNLIPVGSREKKQDSPLVLKPVKLSSIPAVPFSCDYARVILSREKPVVLDEVHLKKIERIERYLKQDCIVPKMTTAQYPVTYNKKEDSYCHIYKFPVQQCCQLRDKVQFLKSLCRPLIVRLERCNLETKKKEIIVNAKILKVMLPRLHIQHPRLRMRSGDKNVK